MKRLLLAASAALVSTSAFAHTGHGEVSGFMAGFLHPFSGADHLLAMLTIGLWSALTLPARQVWVAPAGFVTAMLAGAGLGMAGITLPMVEGMIAFSVLALGLLLAFRLQLPVAAGAGLAALFALFHGHAHGTEATGSVLGYIAGFAIATAMLHLAGVGAGEGIRRLKIARLAAAVLGGGIALAGLALITG